MNLSGERTDNQPCKIVLMTLIKYTWTFDFLLYYLITSQHVHKIYFQWLHVIAIIKNFRKFMLSRTQSFRDLRSDSEDVPDFVSQRLVTTK